MLIEKIRHDNPRKAGYIVDRPAGRSHYTFVHYYSPVLLKCAGVCFETQPGACIMMEPGVSQFLHAQQPLVHNWVHLAPEAKELIERYRIPLNQPFYPREASSISDIFRKIEAEFYRDEPYKEFLLDGYINEFLIWLHRALQTAPPAVTFPQEMANKMAAVRKTILSNPERKWTLAEMAALVPLSPSRFHTIYKALFGITPTQDLIKAKIDFTKSLLRSDNHMALKEIAEISGYNDQYHFIRQFKAVTGQTPGTYRRNAQL